MRLNLLFVIAALCAVAGVSGVVAPVPVSDPGVYGPIVSRDEHLASNGRGYLAVWTQPGWIGGARLDKQGHRLDYELRISTVPSGDYEARSSVASDGANYLVAIVSNLQLEVAFVSSETGLVKRTFQRSDATGRAPQLIWDGSSYVLCWTRFLSVGYGIGVIRLDRDGTVLSSTDLPTPTFSIGVIASNGRDLVMFRSDERGATRATLLASGGGPIAFSAMDFGAMKLIAVASDGERYLAVTRNDSVVSAQLFRNDLTPIGDAVKIGIVDFYSQPAVAARRHGFVVFMEKFSDVNRVMIDDIPSEPYTVLSGSSVQAVIAGDDANALILCHSRLVPKTVSSVRVDLTAPRLLADEEAMQVALEPTVPRNISIASAGGKFAVAWQMSDAAVDRIFVRRFDESGKPLARPVLVGEGDTPSLASDGAGGYLVGWLRRPSIYSTLPALAFLGADGTTKSGILDTLQNVSSIRVIWARDHYAAVWRRNEGVLNSVAVRVSRDGQLIDFAPVTVTAGRRDVTNGVIVESDPLVAVTGTGIFLVVPSTLYSTAGSTTFIDGVLRSFDLDSMRGPEQLTVAPASAPALSANAPLILTFRRSSSEPSRFVRIADDGSVIDDAIGRPLENGQPPASAAWIHDHWVVAWPDRIAFVDANGVRMSAPPISAAAETAFAPSPVGAWYARGCTPPEGDVSQLCLGALTAEAARTQRRAAH